MGLHIQSLKNIPDNVQRNYYIYLLDYGWHEPLGEALKKNFDNMAKIASANNAVVIVGTDRIHFEDEVLSWHSINGDNAEELLPDILITNRHPSKFKESYSRQKEETEKDFKMVMLPLRKFCKSTIEAAILIDKLFKDIIEAEGPKRF